MIKEFPKNWYFLKSVPSLKFLPVEGPIEICFAGRSNVGKSSLINILLNNKNLARTSNTPGRTQELNYFCPEEVNKNQFEIQEDLSTPYIPPFVIVDMPGYGYAQAPKVKVEEWTKLVFDYFRGRRTLKRVYLLIDARHGIKANDINIMKLLDKAAISYQIILTKIDKIAAAEIDKKKQETIQIINKHVAAFPEVLVTSSEKKIGIDEVQKAILTTVDC
ncbi:ribosome biogenesis GTP-binding protein YihA/YsxC [Bartonella sp. DGB1]|uniref:ribosome biogenesis GTP-binding protein YihA/YsxC n=1 Tax=Bartonella sp. DGB1 TaxID=3239807 RepID=UPI0035243804